MLTRKQALTKDCPHRVDYIDNDYHGDGSGVAHQIFHHHKCTANECPKWVDVCDEWRKCAQDMSGITDDPQKCNINCNNCPHRYGRCG